jgi:hypothetical protein
MRYGLSETASTVIDHVVARQDTITQLTAGIRRFGREVPGGKELPAATGCDYTRPGKPHCVGRCRGERSPGVGAPDRHLALLSGGSRGSGRQGVRRVFAAGVGG